MKTRIRRWTLLLAGCAALSGATGTQAPEQLGAHWAQLSDRAQVELLLDGLRSAPQESAAQRIMLRNAHAGNALQVAVSANRIETAPVQVNGASAVAAYAGSGQVQFAKAQDGWHAVSGLVPASPASTAADPASGAATGYSVGTTFIETPISSDQGIDRLSRSVTLDKLGKALFSTPGQTASYYHAHYTQGPPFVTATYIQFVIDRAWNRIVYGNMYAWIKAYDNLLEPTSIAADPSGRLFVGEEGRSQVTVLQLAGDGDAAQLQPSFAITGIKVPSAVAFSDNGTPLDPTDDLLYVADASKGEVLKYRLGTSEASLVATFTGFTSPNAIAAGRWNGANNGLLYVVDNLAKRVRVFDDSGSSFNLIAEYDAGHDTYYSSVATDHFGNVYLADVINARLQKFTSSLDALDEEGGDGVYAALAAIDIPFGAITVDGQGTFWAGFDQLFAVERWSDASGAQRRTLGLRLKDIQFTPDNDAGTVSSRFLLTDFGTVTSSVKDGTGRLIRTVSSSAMVAGQKTIVWDRRDDGGKMVPPGAYTFTIDATSMYRPETTTAEALWTLPLYYEERGGIDDPHLVQGSPIHWGSQSASSDAQSVRYRFTGLNPSSSYAVEADYAAPDDGLSRAQDMTAGSGLVLHQPVSVGADGIHMDFMTIPPAAFATGELVLSVNRRSAGSAVVSHLVLKETGRGFTAQPGETPLPTQYALEQNYPNPFNPSTMIRYDLPEEGPVSIIVYDIRGTKVAELVNEVKPAGSYEVRFDASRVQGRSLASGMYFYRVRAGAFQQTKKMLLLK